MSDNSERVLGDEDFRRRLVSRDSHEINCAALPDILINAIQNVNSSHVSFWPRDSNFSSDIQKRFLSKNLAVLLLCLDGGRAREPTSTKLPVLHRLDDAN